MHSRAKRAGQISHAYMPRRGGLLAVAAAMVALSCGDSSDESAGPCSPGDTRECLGPGACEGAQLCGSDGAWGACDCGENGTGGGADTGGGGDPGDAGASQQGGNGGSGAQTGGAGGTDPTTAVGTLGDSCSPAGALACAGNFQQQRLICGDSGQWEDNGSCEGDEVCDTQLGATAGTCQSQDPACLGQQPGARVCIDISVYECGPDNIRRVLVTTCSEACENGTCLGVADPCPTGVDWVNCAGDCDGDGDYCEVSDDGCGQGAIDLSSRDVQVVRVPPASRGCFCEGMYYFAIKDVAPDDTVRATVSPPFSLHLGHYRGDQLVLGEVEPNPCGAGTGQSCIVSTPWWIADERREFYVVAEDATAAPRNVLLEKVDATATCPSEGE